MSLFLSGFPTYADESKMDTTSFPVSLFQELSRGKREKNLLVSPFSITCALGMTGNGASGSTLKAMSKTLGFENASEEQVNQYIRNTSESLSNLKNTKIEIANALFSNKNTVFKEKFLNTNKEYFGAGLQALDFKSPQATKTINNWVSEKTHGKIPTIVNKIDDLEKLILINAVYFKGLWKEQFKKTETVEKPFYLSSNKTENVKMMNIRKKFNYFDNEDFQTVSLTYKDPGLSLLLFLPAKESSLEKFENSITPETWNTWMKSYRFRPGKVGLPRYKINDDMGLTDSLSKLGMSVAFDKNKANFDRMTKSKKDGLYISKVKHKTFMEVNEEGTEAAAATAVHMATKSAMMVEKPQVPFEIILNRPFFFALRDSRSNTILFMGHVVNPSK